MKREIKTFCFLNPTMQPEKDKKQKIKIKRISSLTMHDMQHATCAGPLQAIRFLRLGCMPANASSSPAPAPATAPESAVSSCPAPLPPPLALDLAFLSFSLCICFVVRCRSSLSFTFFALILDWRYSDFPPPPALFCFTLALEPTNRNSQSLPKKRKIREEEGRGLPKAKKRAQRLGECR